MGAMNLAGLPPMQNEACLARLLTLQRERFLAAGSPTLAERRSHLERLRCALLHQSNAIAETVAADFGQRSRHETLLADIWPVLSAIRHTKRHLAQWMRPQRVPVGLEVSRAAARIVTQPVGVVGIVSPWNYPIQLALVPLVSALAAGNRVMLKPSEYTPRTSEFLASFFADLFPREQVAVVLGDAEVGAAFVRLPFDHLFFTGSTAVGREVMRAAAANLTPVTLELGGKSPCIVGEDADLPAAAEAIVYGKLLSAGQTCIAPDYVLLPEARRDQFVALAMAAVRKFYPRLAANPDYTSIVNQRHYRRLSQYVEEARAAGARVIDLNPAGEALPADEHRMAPTLIVDPDDELAVMQEEIFGPVLPIKSYRALEEAIDYVNRRPRPLALYYFGAGRAGRERVVSRTTSGGVSVNTTLTHIVVNGLPFGGIGASGMGAHHGEFGFYTFSHRKSVFVQKRPNSTILLRPPFGRLTELILKWLMNR